MKKNLNRIFSFKNCLIYVLGIIAIYQTIGLWFENSSNHNLFYTLLSQKQLNAPISSYNIIEPKNIITSFGNKSYTAVSFEDSIGIELNKTFLGCIKYALNSGSTSSAQDIPWDLLLTPKSLIYEYNVLLPLDYFTQTLNINHVQLINIKQSYFDMIIVIPTNISTEKLNLYFINSFENKMFQFECDKNYLNEQLYSQIESLQGNNTYINYLSTKQAKLDIFPKNNFIPEIAGTTLDYIGFQAVNKYDLAISKFTELEEDINMFFTNPVAKWVNIDTNDVCIFNDENTVVRYYPSGLLEYSNYSPSASKSDTLYNAYNLALQFINYDTTIENRIYLSEMSNNDDTWTFGFNYCFKNFAVGLSDSLKDSLGINNIIEITVKKGAITSYKHYVTRLEECKGTQEFSLGVSFSNALNSILEDINYENENYLAENSTISIEDMSLEYLIMPDNSSELIWKANLNNKIYYKIIKRP